MRSFLIGLSVAALASTSVAQIPMSKYVRTFTSSLTRGYFFQAPVDFTVTELQVPDETNKGSYVVALYKLTAAPPAYSSTVAARPTFYAFVKDAHTCAKVPATAGAFKKGDWVAVLGGAGKETGSVANSYGASGGANNPSEVLGVKIANGLQRCGMQINIGTAKGIGKMWSEVSGPIGRVRMVVAKGPYGCDYCPPSGGNVSLETAGPQPAIIGKGLSLHARSGGTTNTGGFLAYGLLKGKIPVPGFGTLCILGIGGLAPFPTVPTGGVDVSVGTIPASTPVGVTVVFQLGLGTTSGIALSNGFEIKTGK